MSDDDKYTRHSIMALWGSTDADKRAECDRIMIAMHRFQTEGKIAYRRVTGMHGGGGGTSDKDFYEIQTSKVKSDCMQHYEGKFPDYGIWPGAVPNACYPEDIERHRHKYFAYTFCWHGAAPFLLWHRALTAEFEWNLQKWDPKYDDDDTSPSRHQGSQAMGLPYWGWEAWDGLTLPAQVTDPIYTVKEDSFASKGFGKGTNILNPFHRWFAPVTLDDQVAEYFPDTMTDDNCTTRSLAFTDHTLKHALPWKVAPSSDAEDSMEDNVHKAISNKDWRTFCTTGNSHSDEENEEWGKGGGNKSIENPHNKFHNRVGGVSQGGLQGPGNQWYFTDGKYSVHKFKEANKRAETNKNDPAKEQQYVGTMTSNQSIFDPIFWLHHGNIERQLMSWQYLWANEDIAPESEPPDALKKTVLYPWTKPDQLYEGWQSWNSPDKAEYNATFEDWWDWKNLRYKFDDLISDNLAEITVPPSEAEYFVNGALPVRVKVKGAKKIAPVRVSVKIERQYYLFGDYELRMAETLLGTASVLSAQGTVCARCNNKNNRPTLHFEVSRTLGDLKAAERSLGDLTLSRNGYPVPIADIEASPWYEVVGKPAAVASSKKRKTGA